MTEDLASLIELNVSEFLLSMGKVGGGSERAEQEITWTVGGSPIGYHNAVVRCDASDVRATELVDEWRGELLARSLPGSWHLTPAMRPITLADLLADAGFEDGGEEPAMAASLLDLDATPLGRGIEITVVETMSDLEDYRRVLASGFGEGPKEANWVASVHASTGLGADGPWRHFLGRVRSEPVAASSLLLNGPTGGIYFVCTSPEFRRRGFGAAITHRSMLEAARCGAEFAVLGSSPMGQNVYEQLGFRTVFSYRLFEFEP
jgi:ribosomal protein S18 acetylase RimI-like enzyme